VYLLGDRDTGRCVLVDPAWDVDGLLAIAEADGMAVEGALLSHWHPDHVGGPMYGHDVQGIARLLDRVADCRIWVHREDLPWVSELTGVAASALTAVEHGTEVRVGGVSVECLHTPGHTRGSQCFRCRNALVSGDTVFLDGCGRVDLPGGDVDEMYRTLSERLAALPGDLVLYPGHNYGSRRCAPLADVRRTNPMLAASGYEAFRALRG
jgi:glyoxylase-like metal-dependent hydrolase (beta-lactamase superfamily II)